MTSFEELYKQVEIMMQGEADDNGGIITKKAAKWIIMKECNVTHRDAVNSKINALVAFKRLVPTNKTAYKWYPDGKVPNNGDGEKAAVDHELKRITGGARA